MSAVAAIVVFVICLAATLAASDALVRGLDRLGARFGLSEGILGLLTALGADAPEISSALAALHSGARDVGLGVVLGSNIFNLAALLGLGAMVAGHVRVRREGLLLDGAVALAVTAIIAALLAGLTAPWPTAMLLAVVCVPYLLALAAPPHQLAELRLPGLLRGFLAVAVSEVDREAAEDPRVHQASGPWRGALLIVPALVVIVAGSAGMVSTALTLANAWQLPRSLVGAVVLAGLTSLPNAYAAIRLAAQGRGAAVVSEALNSNTINVVAGVALPALVFGHGASGAGSLEIAWIATMTLAALALLTRPRGLGRLGGGALICAYLAFVIMRVTRP